MGRGGVPGRPISSPGRWCVHCVCGGQHIHRFGVVMNPDRPVLPSVVDSLGLGVLWGGATRRVDRAVLVPVGAPSQHFIRQECLSAESGGNGKGIS